MSSAIASVLEDLEPWVVSGRVARVTAADLEIRGLRLRIGDALEILGRNGIGSAQVVALGTEGAHALLYGETDGIGRGDKVRPARRSLSMPMSRSLVGRVVDALGRPIDGGPPLTGVPTPVEAPAPDPLARTRVNARMPTGVRVLDTFVTTAKGQRLGIFGGSGVGKSTLLGMMARGTGADVAVLALIGERGREVREFIEDELGPDGMSRCIVVVATSDQPPLMRLRASLLATRIAEWFADDGNDVLLMMDSLTRLAMAQREVGLSAGEPPTARGYTPSVFSLLARLLERAGPREHGTITGFYTVLVEGDDMDDPIADSARSILDGHIVLDRRLAVAGRYPAIDPLASLSRLAAKVVPERRLDLTARARDVMAAADEVRDLVEVGAYVPGTNPLADRGLAAAPHLIEFMKQRPSERTDFEASWNSLEALRDVITGGTP